MSDPQRRLRNGLLCVAVLASTPAWADPPDAGPIAPIGVPKPPSPPQSPPPSPPPAVVDTTGISPADLEVIRQMELLRSLALLRRLHFFVDVPEAPTQ